MCFCLSVVTTASKFQPQKGKADLFMRNGNSTPPVNNSIQ